MKTKLAVLAGALLLVPLGFAAARRGGDTSVAARRPAPRAAAAIPATSESPVEQTVEIQSSRPGNGREVRQERGVREIALLRASTEVDRDSAALALMSASAAEALPEIRKAFSVEKDSKQRLRLAHVLIAQQKRFGHAVEIDGEVLKFLEGVAAQPETKEQHGSAIAALARWETDASLASLGRMMSDSEDPYGASKAAEWLSESRDPKAATTILEAFQATDDEDFRVVAANALLKLSAESPELGLSPVLRGQVRPEIERMLAKADNDWSRESLAKMLEALP